MATSTTHFGLSSPNDTRTSTPSDGVGLSRKDRSPTMNDSGLCKQVTMKTRIAVRDKTPHRFQVLPLKDAPKSAKRQSMSIQLSALSDARRRLKATQSDAKDSRLALKPILERDSNLQDGDSAPSRSPNPLQTNECDHMTYPPDNRTDAKQAKSHSLPTRYRSPSLGSIDLQQASSENSYAKRKSLVSSARLAQNESRQLRLPSKRASTFSSYPTPEREVSLLHTPVKRRSRNPFGASDTGDNDESVELSSRRGTGTISMTLPANHLPTPEPTPSPPGRLPLKDFPIDSPGDLSSVSPIDAQIGKLYHENMRNAPGQTRHARGKSVGGDPVKRRAIWTKSLSASAYATQPRSISPLRVLRSSLEQLPESTSETNSVLGMFDEVGSPQRSKLSRMSLLSTLSTTPVKSRNGSSESLSYYLGTSASSSSNSLYSQDSTVELELEATKFKLPALGKIDEDVLPTSTSAPDVLGGSFQLVDPDGFEYHPLVMELIADLDQAIKEWSGM